MGAQDNQGLRGEISRLQQMLKENKLPKSEVSDRLKTIKTELDRLAGGPLQLIDPALYEARLKPPSPKKKSGLETAQGHQQEVKRTLDELLNTLENWAGLNEFKAELRVILQEQEDLKKATVKIHQQNPDPKNLAPEAIPDIIGVRGLQNRLAERTLLLVEKMERVSGERALKKDINTAKLLEKSAQIAREARLSDNMKNTANELLMNPKEKGGPLLFKATENQTEACQTLELMIEALEEQRDALLEGLIKNQKQEQRNLDEFAERLEKLQSAFSRRTKIGDPKERQGLLDKIAAEERKLQDDLKNKARELARLQAPQAAKKLEQAAKDLAKAAEKLGKGQNPEDLQQDAKKKIEEAKNKLKDAQNKAEVELAREIQSKLADRIRALKERQDAAIVESARLHKTVLQNNHWPRSLLITIGDQIRDQQALAKDVASLKEKVKGAVVFSMVLDKAIQAMENGVKVMEGREAKACAGRSRMGSRRRSPRRN